MVWEVDPLWRVGGCAVHKALHRPASSWRLLEGAVRAFPLDDHNPHRGALVHIRAALELIEEAQHPLIHSVDLPSHTAALPWEVQQTWNVVFSSNHQGVRLHRVALALEGRAAIGVVQQNLVVGLASLQGPIHEHVGHAAGHAVKERGSRPVGIARVRKRGGALAPAGVGNLVWEGPRSGYRRFVLEQWLPAPTQP